MNLFWGISQGRPCTKTPLETAPIRISIIARGGLVVNDFCGWIVMEKGLVVSENPTPQAELESRLSKTKGSASGNTCALSQADKLIGDHFFHRNGADSVKIGRSVRD